MASEIERKYLVNRRSWPVPDSPGVRIRQGYLCVDPERTVRVRIAGSQGFLTLKGLTHGIERAEFEYEIPVSDAEEILDDLCLKPLLEKTRYVIPFGGLTWEVDVFFGENEGLAVAEVELPDRNTHIDVPPWAGNEVSGDPRYFNSNLSRHPYKSWNNDGNG
jgi:adenylate cyclase